MSPANNRDDLMRCLNKMFGSEKSPIKTSDDLVKALDDEQSTKDLINYMKEYISREQQKDRFVVAYQCFVCGKDLIFDKDMSVNINIGDMIEPNESNRNNAPRPQRKVYHNGADIGWYMGSRRYGSVATIRTDKCICTNVNCSHEYKMCYLDAINYPEKYENTLAHLSVEKINNDIALTMANLEELSHTTEKPLVIMGSPESMTFCENGTTRLQPEEIKPGVNLTIDGKMKMPGEDYFSERSEETYVVSCVFDQNSAWDLLIIEGDNAIYVSYEPYRKLIREKDREITVDNKRDPYDEYELEI